jgi:hypothetical protein
VQRRRRGLLVYEGLRGRIVAAGKDVTRYMHDEGI